MWHFQKQSKAPMAWAMLAYPGTRLIKASEAKGKMKSMEYQSVMGKLMYYMTKVAPETVNPI